MEQQKELEAATAALEQAQLVLREAVNAVAHAAHTLTYGAWQTPDGSWVVDGQGYNTMRRLTDDWQAANEPALAAVTRLVRAQNAFRNATAQRVATYLSELGEAIAEEIVEEVHGSGGVAPHEQDSSALALMVTERRQAHLDDQVISAKEAEAASINNEGPEAQVRYLLDIPEVTSG